MTSNNRKAPEFIDGTLGEGGGSILRISAGIACSLKKHIVIKNIRKNRKNPGLRLQHLLGIQALVDITKGKMNDLHVGSSTVEFIPGEEWNPQISVSIRTAGNIGLLCQTIQNALVKAPTRAEGYQIFFYGGGTYGKYAPGTSFLNQVTFKILKKLGYKIQIQIEKHGYYPKGGAKGLIKIFPNSVQYLGLNLLERGQLKKVGLKIHVENRLKKPKVGERISKSFKKAIREFNPNLPDYFQPSVNYHPSLSIGVGVDAWLEYESGCILGAGTVLGERGVSSETVGNKSANKIINLLRSKCTVDRYVADQILPILCLIPHPTQFILDSPSSHFITNMNLLDKLTGRGGKLISTPQGHKFQYK